METVKRHKLQRSKYLEKIVNTLKFLSNQVMLIKFKGKKKIKMTQPTELLTRDEQRERSLCLFLTHH